MIALLWILGALVGLAALSAVHAALFQHRVERRWPAMGRHVQAGSYRLHVVEAGRRDADAPVVLLVHGAASTAHVMLRGLEAALSPHARLLAVDRPGCGYSPAFADRERLAGHADALAQFIDAEGLKRPVVVGHSFGGAIALRLGLDHPERVGAIVVAGTASHGYVGPVSWYNYAAAAPLLGRLLTRCIVPLVGPVIMPRALVEGFKPQTPPENYLEDAALPLLFRPASFRANARDLVRANRELAVQELRYPTLETPLAIIAGEDDATVLTSRHSAPLAAAAPDTRLAIVPGLGHQAQLFAATLITEHVRAFLGENTDASAANAPARDRAVGAASASP